MQFNSIEFLLFLPIVYLIYWYLLRSSVRWQNVFVIVASYVFYGWWNWRLVGMNATTMSSCSCLIRAMAMRVI